MPTQKPRLSVTLEPESYETLKRAGEVAGVPASRMVAELLESFMPVLREMVAAMEGMERRDPATLARMFSLLGGMQVALAQMGGEAARAQVELATKFQERLAGMGEEGGVPPAGGEGVEGD